uniref:Uncharacterized protein n=1 Tax=Rhizophora mucronata TaxID=61149 RepID=A0A2P2PNL0_RHIMU
MLEAIYFVVLHIMRSSIGASFISLLEPIQSWCSFLFFPFLATYSICGLF